MKHKEIPENHQKRLDAIASYLRATRLYSEGYTQTELSKYLNVHRNTLQRAESGKNINLLSLFELIDTLGIRPDEIFQDII